MQATVGFMPCGTSVVSSLMIRDLGGTTKLAPLVALGLFVALTFGDVSVIGVVPKVGFVMVMCNAGLAVLLDNVRRAWAQLSSFEFVMVLLHVLLTVTFDLLSAVVLGLLFTAASFIVEYSRHSGVLQRATLQLERSKVLRAAADHAAIDAQGAAVFIVHLHGMIFFGSANSVVEAVRGHADTTHVHALYHVHAACCMLHVACCMCMCMSCACACACACMRAVHILRMHHAYTPCVICPMRIIRQVRDHARQLAAAGLPRLRSLLLDFDRCSAIDSSAVSVLFQCCRRAQLEPGGLVFACASPSVLPMLRRASPRVPFEHFTTLDLALEYCENRALAAAHNDGAYGTYGAPQASLCSGASCAAAATAAGTSRYAATTDADPDADVSAEGGLGVARRRAFRKSVSDLSPMRVLYAPKPASELPQPSRARARASELASSSTLPTPEWAATMPPTVLTDAEAEARPMPPRAAGPLGVSLVDALPDFSSSLPQGLAEYREKYLAWRTGKARGAKGEPLGAESDGGEWPRVVRQRSAPNDSPAGVRRRKTTDMAGGMADYASEGEARRAAHSAAASSIELEKARSRFVASMQAPRP